MLKLHFSVSFFLWLVLSVAQLKAQVLEHTYTNSTSTPYILSLPDGAYIFLNDSLNGRIYNHNHELVKTIPLGAAPSGFYRKDLLYAYPFFNALEEGKWCLATTYLRYEFGVGSRLHFRLYKEDGTVALNEPNFNFSWINNDAGRGAILSIYSSNSGSYTSKIYRLPNALPTGIATEEGLVSGQSIRVYPNPAGRLVKINYQLPQGVQQGELEILNTAGSLQRSVTVGPDFQEVSVDVSGLTKGVYFSRIRVGNSLLGSQKLVVE